MVHLAKIKRAKGLQENAGQQGLPNNLADSIRLDRYVDAAAIFAGGIPAALLLKQRWS